MMFGQGVVQLCWMPWKTPSRNRGLVALSLITAVLFIGTYSYQYNWRVPRPDRLSEHNRSRLPSFTARSCTQCLPPLLEFDSKFRAAARYGVAACVIEKDMSTVLTAIMCFLTDPDAFRNANRSVTDDACATRLCKDKNEYNSLKRLTRSTQTMVDDWRLFAVVRDPMDRFLSGFVHKCIRKQDPRPNKCYGCGRNMTCFLEALFHRGRQFAAGEPSERSVEDIHFFPQNGYVTDASDT